MQLRFELGSDNRGYAPMGVMGESVPHMKAPRFPGIIDRVLMYAERGAFLYALVRVAASDDFKEVLKNRGF